MWEARGPPSNVVIMMPRRLTAGDRLVLPVPLVCPVDPHGRRLLLRRLPMVGRPPPAACRLLCRADGADGVAASGGAAEGHREGCQRGALPGATAVAHVPSASSVPPPVVKASSTVEGTVAANPAGVCLGQPTDRAAGPARQRHRGPGRLGIAAPSGRGTQPVLRPVLGSRHRPGHVQPVRHFGHDQGDAVRVRPR